MTLTESQIQNAKAIIASLDAIGLTNKFLHAGILSVVNKESGIQLRHEQSYRNTSTARILQIFGKARFQGYDVDILKQDDRKFFDVVYYRADLGNGPQDGYRFRGRGFNQLTGRANYESVGKKIGTDLVMFPESMDVLETASKALAQFFRDSILSGQRSGKFLLRYGIVTTGQISTVEKGATIAHQSNMGWAKTPSQDPTGGYAVTLQNAPFFYKWLMS